MSKAQADGNTAEPSEEQMMAAQQALIQAAVAPFHQPEIRDFIENMRRSHEQIIDSVNLDSLSYVGFDGQQESNAERAVQSFREFIDEHRDELTAMRIIYDQAYRDRPMVIDQLRDLYGQLSSRGVTVQRLWDSYAILQPHKVKRGTLAQLTDLISLVRFELGQTQQLTPFDERVNYNFKQWTFRRNAGPVQFTEEQMDWLRLIKDHVSASLSILPTDLDLTPFDSKGGRLGFYHAFGAEHEQILNEMNEELVA